MFAKALKPRGVAEFLEVRRFLSSVGTLLQYDFNAASPWASMSGTSSTGGTAALIWGGVGTIDTQGSTTPSNALRLTETPPTSGAWTSDINSGQLAVSNTVTNLGLLTLSFNLSATQTDPVAVRVFSYNSAGSVTGGLQILVYPASTYYNQRFAIDLSTMTPYGSGTFDPTGPYVSFSFEMNSQNGWSASSATQLRLDNVNYSKPAYYVNAATGQDTFNGLTESTAFATPKKAVAVSQAGDIIDVMTGTYTITNSGTNAIQFKTAGTAADWIVLKNYPGQTPVIKSEWWNAIDIGGGTATQKATTPALAYLEVRGLDIRGDADYVATTYASTIGQVTPETNGNGLSINGGNETYYPHDIRFADNIVEYCSGGGIGAGECDRIQIENNISRYNCWWNIYACSGISVLSSFNFDGTSGYVTRLVRNNLVYGNQGFNIWLSQGKYSDGNGIIIDQNHNTGSNPNGATVGRTLVTDNVSYDNGGSGIHSYDSNHVDIINNTAYMNSQSPYLNYGQIFAADDSDINIDNNILVAPVAAAGQIQKPVNGGTASFFQNNIYYGGNIAPVMGTGDRVLDPQFVDPTVDPSTANFQLRSTSPAINMGGTKLVPYLDFAGNVRTGLPDIGAYEYYPLSTAIPTVASALPREDTGTTTKLNIVTGTDLGPGPYTYSWSTTSKPTGAANPTISPSSGAGLSNVSTATFTSAGAYSFTLSITDANSLVTTYPVIVTVFQTTTTIAVSPNPKSVVVGATQQFTATDTDQFGLPMTRTMIWATNTSAGSINTGTGLFTASQPGGTYSVSASNNLVVGTATVTVVPTTYNTSGAGYYVRLAPDGVTEQIWIGSPGNVGPAFTVTPTYSIPLTSVPSLAFGPATGSEALTIDLTNGKPIPIGGLSVNGGSGIDALNIIGSSGNDSVTVNSTQILFGTTPITYTNMESISVNLGAGSDTLTQSGQPGNAATLTMVNPTSADTLTVSAGTFTVPAATSGITPVSLSNLSVSASARVILAAATPHTSRNVLFIGTLTLPSGATLDLGGNDLIVSSSASNLTSDALTGMVTGTTGMITSAPTNNPLRAIGISVATQGQVFDNQATVVGNLLIKTTYFGDATLDGMVDGSDYSRIDSGFLTSATGWSNGDFNYDGVINGSDYTLIDNSFNTQGASLAARISIQPVAATSHLVMPVTNTAVIPDKKEKDASNRSIAQTLEHLTIL